MKDSKMELQKTSKTSLLKMMILRAWRERWNVALWGINIKSVLPRGVSGDVYNLADCILQQALVGSNANPLVLNYLKHSLCAHLVSHAAVLRRISKYDHFERTFCITALLEFLEGIIDGVTCRNKPEESILPGAVVSLVHWEMQIIAMVVKNYEVGGKISAEESYMFDHAYVVAQKMVNNSFLMGILYVGRQENPEFYAKISEKYNSIKGTLDSCNLSAQTPPLDTYLKQLACIDVQHLPMNCLETPEVETITYCMQPLLSVEVLLHPGKETAYFVSEMLMIQRLKKFSLTRLFYEILRAGFISLCNVEETSHDALWGAFTFFKVPHIVKQMHAIYHMGEEQPPDFIPELVDAFELLLENSLVLDYIDAKCMTNVIEYLLNDWKKKKLITTKHVVRLSEQREASVRLLAKRDTNNAPPSIINFIIRAEVPLSGILKTLNTDYNKVQEALLGVLCQVLVGNSFDLILSVATVEGRLRAFVSRLIQCNENSKQIPDEVGKPSMIRSTLFDVSFLMLTFVVQTYGSDAVMPENDGGSFFEKWVRECMAERSKPKNPRSILALCDENIVEELLLSLSKPDGQLKSNLTWQDICMNLPGVLNHVLIAWEKFSLSSADVKNILDNIKRRLYAFSVCATSFLCAYMSSVRETEYLKPLNMMQQFLASSNDEEMSSQDNIKERAGLSFQIIRKMQHDAHPPIKSNQKSLTITLTQNLVSQTPLVEQFSEVWKTIAKRGWLPMSATQVMESLLQSGGPVWLARQLVEEIVKCKYNRDMTKTMDIVFAILHLDIERTTAALLTQVVPPMVQHRQHDDINEPQSLVLARLCVYCLISAIEMRQCNVGLEKKRGRCHEDDEEDLGSTAKMRKIQGDTSDNSCSNDFMHDNNFMLSAVPTATGNVVIGGSREVPSTLSEPLLSSVQQMFKVFLQFVSADELSPKVFFVYQFISLLVECGGERVRPVLKLLPPNLIQNLLKVLVTDDISVGLICRLYDLRLNTGRQAAVSDLCLWRNINLKKESLQL